MFNVQTNVSGNKLTITIDLKGKTRESGSGKSNVLASTEGNVEVEGANGLKLGLNAYFAKKD